MANGNNKAAPAAQAPATGGNNSGVVLYALTKKGAVARISAANAAQWAAVQPAIAAGPASLPALAAAMQAASGMPANACIAYCKYLVRLGWLAPATA